MDSKDSADLVNNEVPPAQADTSDPSASNSEPNDSARSQSKEASEGHVEIRSPGIYPILYSTPGSTRLGHSSVLEGGTIETPRPDDDSTGPRPRPLQAKDLKPLVGFSILSLIMLPLTGLPALILAIQTRKEFLKGLDSGRLEVAEKKYKICEKLIIFSVIGGLIMWVIILAIIEKQTLSSRSEYLHHRMALFHT